MRQIIHILLGLAVSFSTMLSAEEKPSESKASEEKAKIKQWADSLKFQTGTVSLGNGLASAIVPREFKYLNPADSDRYLTLLGNPPSETYGIIFPADADIFKNQSWFIVLEYSEDGFVKDDDADKFNYDDMIKKLRADAAASNEERKKEGYGTVEIIGWATPPRYDKSAKKLYWAKEIAFNGSPEHTLNYNIRMLGRKGVLVANAVAGMQDLAKIEAATPQILSMVDFNTGNRYADFDKKTDKVATYGIAGLILGGVGLKIAAKVGILAFAGKWLIALWKPLLIGFGVLATRFKKLFGFRSKNES